MKKILLIILFISIGFGQQVEVGEPEKIASGEVDQAAFPKFSHDGDKIVFTGPKYKGLWVYDTTSGQIQQLNQKKGAGYKPAILNNDTIVFRYDTYKNRRRYSGLAAQSLSNRQLNKQTDSESAIQELVKTKRDLSPPQAVGQNQIWFQQDSKSSIYDINRNSLMEEGNTVLKKTMQTEPIVYSEDSCLVIKRDTEKRISPLEKGHYIWVSLSPDKDKILFTVAGRGTYISNLDGEILAEFGKANYPNWSSDGNWIVYMKDKDDGHRIIESDIWVASADGEKKLKVTDTEERIEMHPEWSPKDNIITFNTLQGDIYILKIKISN